MTALASSLVNWSALGKILLAALIGGAGVAVAFGLLLTGLQRFETSRHVLGRVLDIALVGATGAFAVGAAVFGIVAMTHKSSPKTTHGGQAVKTAAVAQLRR